MVCIHRSWRGSFVWWLVGLVTLVAVGVISAGIYVRSAASASASSLLTSAATCVPLWNPVSNPPESGQVFTFESVVALSANNAWTVGYQRRTSGGRTYNVTLVEHWDGVQWSVVSSPNAIEDPNYLLSISAVSANDIWAAGYYYPSSPANANYQTLIEHWNGTAWNVVPSPNVGGSSNYLTGIAAASANDVWAVGAYTTATSQQAMTMHWNGAQWSIIANPAGEDSQLEGVAAISSSNVWAVGFQYTGGLHQMLIEHWDGAQWSVVPAPETGLSTRLRKVSGSAPNDVWAVGEYSGDNYRTLTVHWNGTQWGVVPSQNASAGSNRLGGVVTLSPTDAWAAGDYRYNYPNAGMDTRTLIEHWDGAQWTIVPSPNNHGQGNTVVNYLTEIAGSGAANVWAVGEAYAWQQNQNPGRGTLPILYAGGCAPTPTATSTPTPTVPTNTPTISRTPTITLTPSDTATYTDTPTPTNSPTDTPTNTFTPTITHTSTSTHTPTYTYTPTYTFTQTYTPTITPTPTVTPTSQHSGPCGYLYVWNMTTACSTASTFSYSIQLDGNFSPGFYVHFEVARDPGASWTQIDQQYVNASCVPCTYNGTFTETNIPYRYSWYRLWMSYSFTYAQPGQDAAPATPCPTISAYGETLPNLLCFFTPATPYPTSTPMPTFTPSALINGHLTWEGIAEPDVRNPLVTGTLTLCAGGEPVTYSNIHTDNGGNFVVNAGLPDGTYNWQFKGAKHLSRAGTFTILNGSVNQEFGTQLTGDTNADNVVNATDFNTLKITFGLVGDEPADFNMDNITNSTDFIFLKNHFAQAGSAMVCP